MTDKANAETRNVYQRKLAVMARCGAIDPDKVHPAHKFRYVSIQTLSNHLRKFAAEEGLDITVAPNEEGTRMVVKLTNVSEPSEQIVESWPIIDGDKGWAYSTKFPLMRMFLVGDGEEGDEAEMSDRSADQTRTTAKAKAPQPDPDGKLSAKELADRAPLYDLAKPLGKSEAKIDSLIDAYQGSLAKARARIEKELEALKPKEVDPQEPVCPICGKADTTVPLADQPGRVRCSVSLQGCGKTYDAESKPARAEWEKWQAEQKPETPKLEALVDEAGVRPA